jgi:hypothetical protein
MRQFSRGGLKTTDVAIGVVLAAIVLTFALVLSGHVPPRGLATGNVRSSHGPYTPLPYKPFASGTLVFREVDGSRVFRVATDASGRYSVTLPPARYRVLPENWYLHCPFAIPECLSPPEVDVIAGDHTARDLIFPGLFP